MHHVGIRVKTYKVSQPNGCISSQWYLHRYSCDSSPRNKKHCACVCAKSFQSCPTLFDPIDCSLPGCSVRVIDSPGKNTGVGCHALLQGLILCLSCLLHWQACSLLMSHLGSPRNRMDPLIPFWGMWMIISIQGGDLPLISSAFSALTICISISVYSQYEAHFTRGWVSF